MLSRRSLVGGLTSFIAAPAIIRVADLMPVRAFQGYFDIPYVLVTEGIIIEQTGPDRIDVLMSPDMVRQMTALSEVIERHLQRRHSIFGKRP